MKKVLYDQLVIERKHCRACIGLRNPAEGDLAEYDSNEIGPWARLHGDLDASIMVVGQDWGDVRYFHRNCGFDDLSNRTIRTLERLLIAAGVEISLREYGPKEGRLFLTNAILCLKDGGLQGPVLNSWFSNCSKFLKKQIEIVSPPVVVALGEKAYRAIVKSFGLSPKRFRDVVRTEEDIILPNGNRFFPVYHCGARILNTHRPLYMQIQDWERVGKAIARVGAQS